jgi:hypothetical protein
MPAILNSTDRFRREQRLKHEIVELMTAAGRYTAKAAIVYDASGGCKCS